MEVGDTSETAEEIDQNPRRARGTKGMAGPKSLAVVRRGQGLRALDRQLLSFCGVPLPGSDVIPVDWVVAGESETTSNNPRLGRARTFTVPANVRADGCAHVEEHIRLEKGSDPAPRVHYWDDTGGRTGKIYVSYLGRHLPNFQTN